MPPPLFTEACQCLIQSVVAARQTEGLRQVDPAKPQSFVSKLGTGERRLDVMEALVSACAMGSDQLQLIEAVIEALATAPTICEGAKVRPYAGGS